MNDIKVEELFEKRKKGEDLLLLDVRQEFEYNMYNIGGKLIPLDVLPSSIDVLESYKDMEIIVVCRSGMRSATAKGILEQSGFQKVRNLVGGVLAWQAAGLDPTI